MSQHNKSNINYTRVFKFLDLLKINFNCLVLNMTCVFHFVIFMMLKLSVTFENSSKENATVSTHIFKSLHSKTFL